MGLLERLAMDKQDDVKPGKPVSIHGQKDDSREDIYKDLKVRIFDKVVEEVTISQENEDNMQIIEDEIRKIANEVIETEAKYLTRNERNIITRDIINETIGFGPITPLLSDPDINEVMVNGPNQVYVERQGRLELSDTTFKDNNHIFHIIERMRAPLGEALMKVLLWLTQGCLMGLVLI